MSSYYATRPHVISASLPSVCLFLIGLRTKLESFVAHYEGIQSKMCADLTETYQNDTDVVLKC